MEITTKTEDFVLYIGCKERYNGREFDKAELIRVVQENQEKVGVMCLSFTRIFYVAGDFQEEGWAIRLINYGRFAKSYKERKQYMIDLALVLMKRFNQNRVSLVGPEDTVMFASDDAEQSHKVLDELAKLDEELGLTP